MGIGLDLVLQGAASPGLHAASDPLCQLEKLFCLYATLILHLQALG